MRRLIFILSLIYFSTSWANDIVDLYGSSTKQSEKIRKKYEAQIAKIETALNDEFSKMNEDTKPSKYFEKLYSQKKQLIKTIQQEGNFAFVDLQTVAYPGNDTLYTTLEVVEKNQPQRLRFIHPKVHTSSSKHHDLIEEMGHYQYKSMKLLMSGQINTHEPCPVYHCIAPFNHPEIKPYLAIFNQGVITQKDFILDTLNHDTDPERRALAAFLVGHMQDPREIIALLSPHVNDQDNTVRNNAIRVIGETIMKAKITDLDIMPFITLLDSPEVTDRNKSLIVLLTAADSNAGKKQLTQKASKQLLALLRLKQPNNHDIAYQILQKISGKNYSATDFKAWENWTHQVSA